jgi:hypothetical protein
MFDPSKMFPKGYHPVRLDKSSDFRGKPQQYSRTECPPRYYFTDLGLSCRYHSREVQADPPPGSRTSAPEHRPGARYNPFHTDIYDLGNLVQKCFMKVGIWYPA